MANWGDLPDDLRDMIVHEATEGPNSDYSWQRNYNGALRLLNTPPWEGGPNNLEEANYYHRIMDDAARFVRDRRRERWRAYVHPGVREMPVPAGEDFHPDANRLTPMERVRYAVMGVAGVVYGVHRLTKAETNLQPDTKKAQTIQSQALPPPLPPGVFPDTDYRPGRVSIPWQVERHGWSSTPFEHVTKPTFDAKQQTARIDPYMKTFPEKTILDVSYSR